MKYTSFEIENYKGIVEKITVPLKKNLVPIIGVNDSGKTSILHAIYAFDYYNDDLYKSFHIKDLGNINDLTDESSKVKITATIEIVNKERFKKIFEGFLNKNQVLLNENPNILDQVLKNDYIKITREFVGEDSYYLINFEKFKFSIDDKIQNDLVTLIINNMPYLIYINKFDESINDIIKVNFNNIDENDTFGELILEIFNKGKIDIKKFLKAKINDRKTKLKHLNDLLNRKIKEIWNIQKDISNNLAKDDSSFFKELILLDLSLERLDDNFAYFNLSIVNETNGRPVCFSAQNISSGMLWLLNFIFRLDFNTKYLNSNFQNSVFLLDEPGAYLHAQMQRNLAKKFNKMSNSSTIIYTTHSNYLLAPKHINPASIMIANNDILKGKKTITLKTIQKYYGKDDYKFVLEPVYDILGLNYDIFAPLKSKVVLVEGITDFRLFSLVKNENITFMPFTGATKIGYYINIFLAIDKPFICLYDSDSEGKKAIKKLQQVYKQEANFFLYEIEQFIPNITELEDIFDEEELKGMMKKFNIEEDKDIKSAKTEKEKRKSYISWVLYELNSKEDNLEDLIPKTLKTCREIISQLEKEFSKQKN